MAFRYTHANCFTDMMLLHQIYKVKKRQKVFLSFFSAA